MRGSPELLTSDLGEYCLKALPPSLFAKNAHFSFCMLNSIPGTDRTVSVQNHLIVVFTVR
jgi:hypothetical protein